MLAYEFLDIMKIQLDRYCPMLNYFVFGDHAVVQMLSSNAFNMNLFVELSLLDNDKYENFLHQLLHTTIDIFKIFNPDILIVHKHVPGFQKSIEVFEYGSTPLFCFNFGYDQFLVLTPYFSHELLAQNKYGNLLLLEAENQTTHNTIFDLLKMVNNKRLQCNNYIVGGLPLHHTEILHYIWSVQQKLRSGWRVLDKIYTTYQNECVICYESMHRHTLIGLGCNHYFHHECFKKFIENDHEPTDGNNILCVRKIHKCPTCKQNINELKVKYYINNSHEQKSILQPLQESPTRHQRRERVQDTQHQELSET